VYQVPSGSAASAGATNFGATAIIATVEKQNAAAAERNVVIASPDPCRWQGGKHNAQGRNCLVAGIFANQVMGEAVIA
jgi:hypothetical protein